MKRSDFKHIVKDSLREAFYTKKVLTESMNLYVKGASYDRLETLGEISFRLLRPVWDFIDQTLPADQKVYFMKNRTPYLLTPDGPYYDEPTGVLNLYTAGLIRNALIGVMKIIFDGLKKLGVTYGKVKKEPSGTYKSEVIRIPITNNPYVGSYKGPPELNLSNVNAYQIFHNVLQYEGEHEFEMEADELMERIESLAHDQGWVDKNAIKPTDSAWPQAEYDPQDVDNPHLDIVKQVGDKLGGARMIGGGISGERIRDILEEIWQIAKWANDHGFERLYVA